MLQDVQGRHAQGSISPNAWHNRTGLKVVIQDVTAPNGTKNTLQFMVNV